MDGLRLRSCDGLRQLLHGNLLRIWRVAALSIRVATAAVVAALSLSLSLSLAAAADHSSRSATSCPSCPAGTVRVEWYVKGTKVATMGVPDQGARLRHKNWIQDAVLHASRGADGTVRLTLTAGTGPLAPRRQYIVKPGERATVPSGDEVARAIAGPSGVDIAILVLP